MFTHTDVHWILTYLHSVVIVIYLSAFIYCSVLRIIIVINLKPSEHSMETSDSLCFAFQDKSLGFQRWSIEHVLIVSVFECETLNTFWYFHVSHKANLLPPGVVLSFG